MTQLVRNAPNPTQIVQPSVLDKLAQIFKEGGGTVIAQSINATPTPPTGMRYAGGLTISGYIIQEIPLDPPLYVQATDGPIATGQLSLAQVKTSRTLERLWRITVLGSGFSTNYPVGAVLNPKPVSVWIDDKFLGYAWRDNPLDRQSGPTLLIHDSTPIQNGAFIGIGQPLAHDMTWDIRPTPIYPEVFSEPIHLLKSPE